MSSDRTILITGVTGNQGGATAGALQGTGFHLRGMTRKPESERAAALAKQGIEIVQGDLDDEATLRRAWAVAWGVFGVQNTGEAGGGRGEGDGARPPLPRARDPATGVLHGEPAGALQSPGLHAGLGARPGPEAADGCSGGYRLGWPRRPPLGLPRGTAP